MLFLAEGIASEDSGSLLSLTLRLRDEGAPLTAVRRLRANGRVMRQKVSFVVLLPRSRLGGLRWRLALTNSL
jgi:hypothetical protein